MLSKTTIRGIRSIFFTSSTEGLAFFISSNENIFKKISLWNNIGEYLLSIAEKKLFIDHYFDSINRDLYNNNYALRIRESKGNFILSLKSLGNSINALHKREEYEVTIPNYTSIIDITRWGGNDKSITRKTNINQIFTT